MFELYHEQTPLRTSPGQPLRAGRTNAALHFFPVQFCRFPSPLRRSRIRAYNHGRIVDGTADRMCSRYNLTSPPETVRRLFGLAAVEPFPPRYNIAPGEPVAIVRSGRDGLPELVLVRWGLIPSWTKDPRDYSTPVNARIESVSEKPSFRGALRHRRCLVPANGFYEWSGAKGRKRPYHIHARRHALLAFAGLWEHWLGADGSEIETMAIITMPANRVVAGIHDRMPAVVAPGSFGAWLDCRSGSAVGRLSLIEPTADDLLEAAEVSSAVNDPRQEGPLLVEPLQKTLL